MELDKNPKFYLSDNISIIPSEKSKKEVSNNINKTFINIIFILIFAFFLLFFIYSNIITKYNNTKGINNNQLKNFKQEKYSIDSHYEKITPKNKDYIYIPIISTNDFHGKFFPELNKININNKKIEYKTGGLEYIAKYINILKKEFGNERVLYFDSGDQYFLSNETVLFDGKNILDFLNTIGLNGTTLGNHEYLYKKSWIENIIKKAKFPYLINNIRDITNNKTNHVLGNNNKNSYLYEIKINNKDIIKIGVIGITMQIGEDKRFYNVGNRQTWSNITFESHYYNLEQESNKLKSKGANAVILLSHIGLLCNDLNETNKLNMYNKNTKQSECQHDGNSLLYEFIKKLKPGLIDAIIGGDTHNNVHHWIDNIPIMISKGKTKYLNIMYLPFKKRDNKYILINDQIKIEGPLPSCDKIFKHLNHCDKIEINDLNILKEKNLELINYYWRGQKIGKDIQTKALFDKYYNIYKKIENKKLAKIIGFKDEIKIELNGDCILGNLILDIIRNITNSDISIVNFWMFQHHLSYGNLSLLDFIRLMPRENYLCVTEIKGKEIKKMIRAIQKGERGFQPTSGLKQYVKLDHKNKSKEIVDIKLYNKKNEIEEIDDDKIYILSSNNFVLSEFCEYEFAVKDSLDVIKDLVNKGKIKCSKEKAYVEIMHYFNNKGIIDINKDVDMTKKRIVFIDK